MSSHAPRRHSGWRELGLLAGVYAVYEAARLVARGDAATAVANARDVLAVESALHLDIEQAANAAVTSTTAGLLSTYAYAALHYLVTPVVLVWLWRTDRSLYVTARRALVLMTVVGMVAYSLYPVAPPRLIGGYVDTMAQWSAYGWWSDAASAPAGAGHLTNQFAAMPSLHVGWALWCSWVLSRRRAMGVGTAWWAYGGLINVVVVVTANHYVLDAVAGAALALVAAMASLALARRARPEASRAPALLPAPVPVAGRRSRIAARPTGLGARCRGGLSDRRRSLATPVMRRCVGTGMLGPALPRRQGAAGLALAEVAHGARRRRLHHDPGD